MAAQDNAIVLLSGGLDSTTVLAMAIDQGYKPHALSFRYGQRHSVELEAARKVATAFGPMPHIVADIDLRVFGGSALTADIEVPKGYDQAAGALSEREQSPVEHSTREQSAVEQSAVEQSAGEQSTGEQSTGEQPVGVQVTEIPVTYVPARNTVFLSFALAWAEVVGAEDIFIGVNALDYSGYPDCRPEYISAYEHLANLATKAGVEGTQRLKIHAPLMSMTKAQIIQTGLALGVDYAQTHSCYDPDTDGNACGRCDSCALRLKGFAEAGSKDPAPYTDMPTP